MAELNGTEGDDIINGSGENDIIDGKGGNDTLNGLDGDDWIIGGSGNDYIRGGAGDDTLDAGAGDDIITPGSGRDIIDGGDSNDTVWFRWIVANEEHSIAPKLLTIANDTDNGAHEAEFSAEAAEFKALYIANQGFREQNISLWIDMQNGYSFNYFDMDDGEIQEDSGLRKKTFMNIENVTADTMVGEDENGQFVYGSAIIEGDGQANVIFSGEGDDWLFGNGGNDQLHGTKGKDMLDGGDGDDHLRGGAGNDVLIGGAGADRLDGGDGNDDLALYVDSDTSVDVNLQTGVGYGGHAEGDELIGIEDVHGSAYSDTLIGDAADNLLLGFGGDDIIAGGDGHDVLIAHDGEDQLHGGSGDDIIYGGSENDTVIGGDGHDSMFGGEGNDDLRGGDGGDVLHGNAGNDYLRGGNGIDRLYGGSGDDVITPGADHDTLDGGEGQDTAWFRWISANDESNAGQELLSMANNSYNPEEHPEYSYFTEEAAAFKELYNANDGFGSYDVSLWVDLADGYSFNYYDAIVEIHDGAQTTLQHVNGLSRNTLLNIENVTANAFAAEDGRGNPIYGLVVLEGDDNDNEFIGGVWHDRLFGNGGDDTLDGAEGNDVLIGGAGNDTFISGAGADRMDGGEGVNDTAVYVGSKEGVSVYLDGRAGSGGDAEGDTLTRLEDIQGSAFGDTLIGNNAENHLAGYNGHDVMDGGKGDDSLSGGLGNDELTGGSGNDMMFGEHGHDFLVGGSGHDFLSGGTGRDTLYGGNGDDQLYGDDGADDIIGGNGNDTLNGGAGMDTLSDDGDGMDTFTGGAGADLFTFDTSDGVNTITDFSVAERDKIIIMTGDYLFNIENVTVADNGDHTDILYDSRVVMTLNDIDHNDVIENFDSYFEIW